ncbi:MULTISPECIES: hypothetical protein [Nitrospirillum]|nr:hypothetical protein [Nitrospirillum amazonense]MEC4593570.1 hypothetical protein [Nitrospirillum amazonense]
MLRLAIPLDWAMSVARLMRSLEILMEVFAGGKYRTIAIFFIIIFLALLVSSWRIISAHYVEASDFATNTLLIMRIKSFSLWIGNYSRVGFNHPGPALLYVLGLGEFIFFNGLHLVASPLGGQLLAVLLYNSFWITALFVGMIRISRAPLTALMVVSVFLLLAAWVHYEFFMGLWFPDLYFFPYVVMVISAARLAAGRTDMLYMLALSAGFLMNGHVSFIPMLGVIFILLCLYNIATYHSVADRCLIRRAFFAQNAVTIGISVLILFLFFVPALITTINEFPGPFADYAKFGRQHAPNSVSAAWGFISQYWGGKRYMLVAMVLAVVLLVGSARSARKENGGDVRALLASLVAATGSVLFYARYGVDDVSQNYICLFYYSVPLLFPSTLLLWHDMQWVTGKKVVYAMASVALLGEACIHVNRVPDYAVFYDRPDIANLYQAMEQHKGQGRMVLDTNNGPDWPPIWISLTGVDAYALRKGEDLFCVNKNWHISFTKEGRCRSEEVAHNNRYKVERAPNPLPALRPGDFESDGILFRRYVDPSAFAVGPLPVAGHNDEYDDYLLASGWSKAEEGFVWMMASEARITVPPVQLDSGILTLDLGAYLPKPDSRQTVSVSVNGAPPVLAEFTMSASRQQIHIPFDNPTHAGIDVRLVDNDLMSPAASGLSSDTRTLGVSLYGLDVQAR